MFLNSFFFFFMTDVYHFFSTRHQAKAELVAVNGSDVKLSCTFKSTQPVSDQSVTVTWNYRPPNSQAETSVFYHQGTPYPEEQGLFKGRVVWSGNVVKRDASITLQKVSPTFNGTYTCQVKNRPDVLGNHGEIDLKVFNINLSVLTFIIPSIFGRIKQTKRCVCLSRGGFKPSCLMLPVLYRSLTSSSLVVLSRVLTFLKVIETPLGKILHGAQVRGRLSVIFSFFHFLIFAPIVDLF
uniref:Myelin protein zero-like 2b n=1 Tax=Oryzias latipes TaxID=8090 RepID=A0A3P9HD22_ORYLA